MTSGGGVRQWAPPLALANGCSRMAYIRRTSDVQKYNRQYKAYIQVLAIEIIGDFFPSVQHASSY